MALIVHLCLQAPCGKNILFLTLPSTTWHILSALHTVDARLLPVNSHFPRGNFKNKDKETSKACCMMFPSKSTVLRSPTNHSQTQTEWWWFCKKLTVTVAVSPFRSQCHNWGFQTHGCELSVQTSTILCRLKCHLSPGSYYKPLSSM